MKSKRLHGWLGDLAILAGIAACFGLFAERLRRSSGFSSGSESVGTLDSGHAARKSAGSGTFSPITPGTSLRNLDTLWIDAGENATILWMGGEKIAFSERTLTVLKKPFSSSVALKSQVIVLRGIGKVYGTPLQLGPGEGVLGNLPEILPPAEPGAKLVATSPPDIPIVRIQPKPDTLMYSPQADTAEIGFAWFKPLSGYVVIRDESTASVDFFPIQEESYLKLARKQNRAYVWQVIDAKRQRILGPFRFELKVGDPNQLESLLRQEGHQPTEINLGQ